MWLIGNDDKSMENNDEYSLLEKDSYYRGKSDRWPKVVFLFVENQSVKNLIRQMTDLVTKVKAYLF